MASTATLSLAHFSGSMANVQNLIEFQYEMFGLIRRAVSNLKKKEKDNITAPYITAPFEALKFNWSTFQDNHSAKHAYFTDDVRTQCEDEFVNTKVAFRAMLEAESGASAVHACAARASTSGSSSTSSLRSLPRINLPQFSGSYNERTAFRDLFNSLVLKNTELSLVEKFHYLKTSSSERLPLTRRILNKHGAR